MIARSILFRIGLVGLFSLIAFASQAGSKTYHRDHRSTPKLIIAPDFKQAQPNHGKRNGVEMAKAYIQQNARKFGLPNDLSNLSLSKEKESLTAKHYHFQQMLNGIPVYRAEIVVSINKKSGKIAKVFNNTYPVSKSIPLSKSSISADAALSRAWTHLQADGLKAQPKKGLNYINEGANFRLVYITYLSTKQPFGDWEHLIDASDGKVIRAYRTDLPIYKNANADGKKRRPFARSKNHRPIADALQKFSKRHTKAPNRYTAKADGRALVFDPDPRTSLENENLEDDSAASVFASAYFSRELLGITEDNGTYSLVGDWVSIIDWDEPFTAPSTTTDGVWTANRGDLAFNDAMTYFHIDQNQRYIQSLGFTGATGIQEVSIEVDANGAEGEDQSYYSPGPNRLSFGHGCVDDNEDADVILHEYGHAINYSINNNWSGGDTGSMGEGFGDYWAVSYSYSTPSGQSFHPEWVFSWDGHNNCWSGRVVNRTNFRYDSSQTYGAHQTVNGQLGDELWSTPLAQTLFQLMQAGTPREEVDQIILEAQFGLGSGVTMPEMAVATVVAASTLFPNGDHAQTFSDNFEMMEILNDSLLDASIQAGDLTVVSAGDDTVVLPGETVAFTVALENQGIEAATSVSATVSSVTSGVTVGASSSAYPNIAIGGEATNQTNFQLTVPSSHTCGNDISLDLQATYQGSSQHTDNFDLLLPVGILTTGVAPGTPIPDNDTTGISSQITVSGAGTGSLSVDVNITHTYRGDLSLRLTSPVGTVVDLVLSSNDSEANIIGNYPGTITPEESLQVLSGQNMNGVWTLQVIDQVGEDTGTLNSWAINVQSASCPSVTPTPTPTTSNFTNNNGGGGGGLLFYPIVGLLLIRIFKRSST